MGRERSVTTEDIRTRQARIKPKCVVSIGGEQKQPSQLFTVNKLLQLITFLIKQIQVDEIGWKWMKVDKSGLK